MMIEQVPYLPKRDTSRDERKSIAQACPPQRQTYTDFGRGVDLPRVALGNLYLSQSPRKKLARGVQMSLSWYSTSAPDIQGKLDLQKQSAKP